MRRKYTVTRTCKQPVSPQTQPNRKAQTVSINCHLIAVVRSRRNKGWPPRSFDRMHEISIVLHIAMTLMVVLLEAYVVYMCSHAHVGILHKKGRWKWRGNGYRRQNANFCLKTTSDCTWEHLITSGATKLLRKRNRLYVAFFYSFIYFFIFSSFACWTCAFLATR